MRTAALLPVLGLATLTCLRAAEAEGSREALETKFKETMANATLSGKSLPLKDGALGEAKRDAYSIVSAEKRDGDRWIINARFKDVVVPIPVKVQWAGDTAVIIVENLQMPGKYAGSMYNARVLIHEKTYAGTWTGGERGGFVSGVITNR